MMKTLKLGAIIFAFFILLILAGCAGNTNNAAGNTQVNIEKKADNGAAESNKKTFDKLYNYGALKSFEYKMMSDVNGKTNSVNMKYSIKSDSVDGNAAWLQESTIIAEGANVLSKMWIDKVTYKCLKISSSVSFNGQEMETSSECPKEGPNAADSQRTTMPEVTFVGKESVTVPAGTFMADKYSLEGADYWVASSIGVPIKVAYAQGQTVMELVSYS